MGEERGRISGDWFLVRGFPETNLDSKEDFDAYFVF